MSRSRPSTLAASWRLVRQPTVMSRSQRWTLVLLLAALGCLLMPCPVLGVMLVLALAHAWVASPGLVHALFSVAFWGLCTSAGLFAALCVQTRRSCRPLSRRMA